MQCQRLPPCSAPLALLKRCQLGFVPFIRCKRSKLGGKQRHARGRRYIVQAGDDEPLTTEQLFEKELKKRGYNVKEGQLMQGDKPVGDPRKQAEEKQSFPGFRGASSGQGGMDQLERSRKLNSEGLEGLIPRATELVKLGGSFWVAFWPFMAAIIAATVLLSLFTGFTGTNFIHDGSQSMAIPEYLPRELLQPDLDSANVSPSTIDLDLSGFKPNM